MEEQELTMDQEELAFVEGELTVLMEATLKLEDELNSLHEYY